MTTLLTQYDVADLLKIPSQRALRMAKRGLLPCVVLPGGDIRFDEYDLREWIEDHKREPSVMEGP